MSVLRELGQWLGASIGGRLSARCYHLRGRGGRHGAARQVGLALRSGRYRYVCRSDVRGYYASIDTDILYWQLCERVRDRRVRDLLYQYLHRCVCREGEYRCVDQGLPAGGVLSPLLGALYLDPLDRAMEKLHRYGIFYVRYMDDWVILAPNRYKLRWAIRAMNQVLCALKLEQHPDKTFMGKLSGGFEALGFRFRQGVGLCGPSTQAIQRLAGRLTERYAQHRGRESLRQYVHRWISSHFGPHTAVRCPP